jgi:DEAD/DEAH box helicase domain-containing protein
VGRAAIFIYDGYPGGVGLSVRAYEILEDLVRRALSLTTACPCEDGCPSCIHSPKCGSGNKPLDKEATVKIAAMLLGEEEVEPPAEVQIVTAPAPAVEPVPESETEISWFRKRKIGVLDLETCCSAADVGGWGQCHRMGVSLVVLQESHTGVATTYREHDLKRLGERLKKLDLIVGFNIKRFDYQVLQPYTTVPLAELPTLDILEEVHVLLGHRLSLNHLAEKTLGEKKTGDGLLALELYAAGKWEELESYCRQDVLLTHRLFEYGVRHGYLVYQHRQGALVRCR